MVKTQHPIIANPNNYVTSGFMGTNEVPPSYVSVWAHKHQNGIGVIAAITGVSNGFTHNELMDNRAVLVPTTAKRITDKVYQSAIDTALPQLREIIKADFGVEF
jgi:hypothetical protein